MLQYALQCVMQATSIFYKASRLQSFAVRVVVRVAVCVAVRVAVRVAVYIATSMFYKASHLRPASRL